VIGVYRIRNLILTFNVFYQNISSLFLGKNLIFFCFLEFESFEGGKKGKGIFLHFHMFDSIFKRKDDSGRAKSILGSHFASF